MPTILYLVHIFLYLSNSIKITTNTDKSVTQSNLLGQASASYANNALSCPYFLPHKLHCRQQREPGRQVLLAEKGGEVENNRWYATSDRQWPSIGFYLQSLDCSSCRKLELAAFLLQIILNHPPAWLFSLKLTDSTSLRCNTPITTCNELSGWLMSRY